MFKSCRNVLSGIRSISNNTEETLCIVGDAPYICRLDDLSVFYDYSNYKNEIQSIIDQLVLDGYLKYSINQYHFSLTQKGLHPYQLKLESVKHFLFTSVLVPIFVSVATTIITLVIKGWLG